MATFLAGSANGFPRTEGAGKCRRRRKDVHSVCNNTRCEEEIKAPMLKVKVHLSAGAQRTDHIIWSLPES